MDIIESGEGYSSYFNEKARIYLSKIVVDQGTRILYMRVTAEWSYENQPWLPVVVQNNNIINAWIR